jgi:hypothetical protein
VPNPPASGSPHTEDYPHLTVPQPPWPVSFWTSGTSPNFEQGGVEHGRRETTDVTPYVLSIVHWRNDGFE